MKPFHCTILAAVGGIMAAVGLLWPAGAWLAPIGGLLWIGTMAVMVGWLSFPEERAGIKIAFGAFGTVALLAAFGALTYWFHALDALSIALLLIVLPWLVFACTPLLERKPAPALPVIDDVRHSTPADLPAIGFMAVALVADAAALRFLAVAATSNAIRSPWDVVNHAFFLWIFVGTAALIGLAARCRYRQLALFAVGLHLFTMLAPALFVYALGYGFDSFVHIAAEARIAAFGLITPKTPYYLGQYAVVTILARLFRLPVASIDRLLVPGLAAVFLPLATAYLLRRGFKLERRVAALASLGLFLLPLAPFVTTTPQGLADLFAVVVAMLGTAWLHDHRPNLPYLAVLVVAAVLTHPLAGVPAALLIGFVAIFKLRPAPPSGWSRTAVRTGKAVLFIIMFVASVAALPVLFAWNAARSGDVAGFSGAAALGTLADDIASLPSRLPSVETRFQPLLDVAQLIAGNRDLIVLGLAIFGIWLLTRTRSYRRSAWVASACGAGFLISAFALRHGLTVGGVIGYEQGSYGDRLFETTQLLLAPAILAAVAWWWRQALKSDRSLQVFAALLCAALTTTAAYAMFPRNDAYAFSRSWSVSRQDVQAVQAIDKDADGAPYVVLADQSVSAAALQTFGFRTYYGDQYFYAIPTGGRLYQSYLAMIYGGARRKTVLDAMQTYGVKRAYFVLNAYWTDFEKINAAAVKTADRHFTIDGGTVTVYVYQK